MMMRFLLLLILALFSHQSLSAQAGAYYTIQVGTFIDAKSSDFEALRPSGVVYANKLGGNLMEVYIGGFRDRGAAQQTLSEVQKKGYPNAFIQERNISGQVATVVQLATRDITKGVDWPEFMEVSNLYAILNSNIVKIVTGPYASSSEAKQAMANVRSLGFKDAFVKNINADYLHPLTAFEMGMKKELIPMEFDNSGTPPPASTTNNPVSDQPDTYSVLQPRTPNSNPTLPGTTPVVDIPSNYDYAGTSGTSPVAGNIRESMTSTVALPSIDGKIKRTSALELQKILKAKGAYNSSLDGYYGNGTKAAYDKYSNQDRFMQKYELMAENLPLPGSMGSNSDLQQLINALPANPAGAANLRNRNEPVAQAYLAYDQFTNYGPSNEVNQMMVAANRAAFAGQTLSNLPFDPNATYSYQDLGQLILHLHYIHCAERTKVAVPCWMLERHPQEAARAMQACAAFVGKGLKLQGCGQFETWPEVRMLVMVANDLNANPTLDDKRLAQASSERARLYMAPTPLNNTEQKAVVKWKDNLISGLNSWGTRDPLNQQMVTTFRVLFFQSQVRLEDYFMQKGYKKEEATGLALAALHTLVAYHTQRFV